MKMQNEHEKFMTEALKEARLSYDNRECPVGAVMVRNGEIVARAQTQIRALKDATAHAEILVMRQAGQKLAQWKFPDCVIYTTIQPCPMCENAMLQAEVAKVVYGGRGFKSILEKRFAKSNLERVGPVMDEPCRSLFIKWLKDVGHQDIIDAEGL